MGYLKAGSVMSLGMGMLFGTLAGLGAYRSSVNKEQYALSLIVSLAMFARFAQSFYQTGKVMPAGVVMVFSLVMVLRYGARTVL